MAPVSSMRPSRERRRKNMSSLMHQGRATYAFFERNWNLAKRYWGWEVVWLVYNVVNALSVTYIGFAANELTGGIVKLGPDKIQHAILFLLIGTTVWSYLSVTFEGVTDMITFERWEGTIEHTFMAPISRVTHLIGSCWYAVAHGLLFAFIQLGIVALFFHLDLSHANYLSTIFILMIGSISFVGFGIGAAILPLLFTERGSQMSWIVRAMLLLISGVYYPISVLPDWMQLLARVSPVTYVLEGSRAALMNGAPIWSAAMWANTWPLLLSGAICIPLGLYVFRLAERYAKRAGKLKRNG